MVLDRYEYIEKDDNGQPYVCSFTVNHNVKTPISKAKKVEKIVLNVKK